MAELASSLTLGFLHVLETLSPVERVVFVLADVFDVPFRDIAEAVGKSPEACRQLASRARRVHDARPHRYSPPDDESARGMVIYLDGERQAAMNFEVEDGVVCEVHIIVADDKLAALDRQIDVL